MIGLAPTPLTAPILIGQHEAPYPGIVLLAPRVRPPVRELL